VRALAHRGPRLSSSRRAPARRREPSAQGIVEYGLILALSAVLALVLLVFFGGAVSAFLQVVGDAIDAAS